MNARPAALALLLLLPAPPAAAQDAPPPPPPSIAAHEVSVVLVPAAGSLSATDRMTVRRGGGGTLAFDLRTDLKVLALEVDGRADDSIAREEAEPRPGVSRYRVRVPKGPGETGTVVLTYAGVLRGGVTKAGDLAFVAGDSSAGTVSPEGVFLSEGTAWVPTDGGVAPYAVTATVPEGWTVASQGGVPAETAAEGRTTVSFPPGPAADGLWLQAGKWKVERRSGHGGVSLATYLSEGNAALSKTILDAVDGYLERYARLLGPYPHAKFDVVENFFTTGYGMPSATLLGGDVIRHMGAMAERSGGAVPPGYLDHELVHGWWGNGVLVDYASGNWCEGLTTYCSNYLRKEWESAEEAERHRRGVRARFAARVAPAKDYPLRRFTGKTEDFENDIGYGKASMLFHAVRRAVGDEAFFGALRDLAKERTGTRASWDDLRGRFEKRSGRNLQRLFDTMLDRTGAPVLALRDASAARTGDAWTVTGRIVQGDRPWPVALPLVVETAAGVERTTVDADGPETGFSVRTASMPLRVLLDPGSDAWRGFPPGEAPAMLDATLHDPAGFDCLLSTPNAGIAYAPVVEAVKDRAAAVCTPREDGTFDRDPAPSGTRSLLVLGHLASGGLAEEILRLFGPRVVLRGQALVVGGKSFEGPDVALLASRRHPQDPRRGLTIYGGLSDGALAAARRVFFYGGDGIVVFRGGRPVLRVDAEGDASSRAPLLDSALKEVSAQRVRDLVAGLCAPALLGRRAGTEAGSQAVDLVAEVLKMDGHAVVKQEFALEVADFDGSPCLGIGGKPAGPAGIPFCFSPGVPEWKRAVALPVGADASVEGFLAALHEALDRGAEGVVVHGPPEPPAALADYLLHPSTLPDALRAQHPDAELAVEGRRARLLMPSFEVKVPVVYFPREPEKSWLPSEVRSPVVRKRVATANVFAVIPGSDPALAGEAILLGAHHDHLGPGYPGANDDASGVAAVREAGRALLARRGDLRRPVVLAFFGAEEWGLAGSRRFAAERPEGVPAVAAAMTLDAVGGAGIEEVDVVGVSVYPALAAAASRCLAGAGLRPGRDIDKFAFAWGSDHYALHRAGIPAIDLFSMEYRAMHTPEDAPSTVDPEKTARIARAAAAWALSLSGEGLPR
jgi:hypothetical protein